MSHSTTSETSLVELVCLLEKTAIQHLQLGTMDTRTRSDLRINLLKAVSEAQRAKNVNELMNFAR